MESQKIRFKGQEYWLIGGALAWLDVCDENGELLDNAFEKDSYAHLYGDGNVRRYGVVIGTEEDIEYL